jgi:hypothetical protein
VYSPNPAETEIMVLSVSSHEKATATKFQEKEKALPDHSVRPFDIATGIQA